MIIIDSDNYAASGIDAFFFPGGEPHVKVPDFTDDVLLYLKLRTWNDVGLAAALIDTLERRESFFRTFIPYFPGARQDRTDGRSPLTLELMGRVLGKGVKWSIDVFDPHSHAIHDRMVVRTWMPSDLPIPTSPHVVGVIVPDAGAYERACQFRDTFYPDVPLVQCAKKREFGSGKFTGYYMNPLPAEGRYIVVDDICDGGGTFNLLAQAFDADPHGPRSALELFVSHGIFSKGLRAISPRYTRITTTDSWCRAVDHIDPMGYDARLTVIPLMDNLKERLCA